MIVDCRLFRVMPMTVIVIKLCYAVMRRVHQHSRDCLAYCCGDHGVWLDPDGNRWTQQRAETVLLTKCAAVTSINLRCSLTNRLLNDIQWLQA